MSVGLEEPLIPVAARFDAARGLGPLSGSFYQPYDEQQNHRTNESVDDGADEATADIQANERQQPASDDRADDADDNVAD